MSTTTSPAACTLEGGSRTTVGPILLAATGDDGAPAIATARRLADFDGRDVAVVSAVELPPTAAAGDGTLYVPDVAAYAESQAARVRRQVGTALGAGAELPPIEVVVDEPSRAIADTARQRAASLVVLGSGRHDLTGRLFGEVALRTVRRAPCPVLVVGREPLRVPPMTAIAAVDFSASSVVAARAALRMLGAGGTLHLVHVWQRHAIDTPAMRAQDESYALALPERFARLERELRERPDVTLLTLALVGDAVEQLAAVATVRGADLIAAGRQGHGLLELLFVGRVTSALLRAADCAVLVTPEPTLGERDALERVLTGTSESRSRGDWGELLDAFSRRNVGRRTRLEVDDPALGAQTQEAGYALLGAVYDRHDHRVTLMFGDADDPTTHLTRAIERVSSVAVSTDADGRDTALRLTHGTGQTLLTFRPTG